MYRFSREYKKKFNPPFIKNTKLISILNLILVIILIMPFLLSIINLTSIRKNNLFVVIPFLLFWLSFSALQAFNGINRQKIILRVRHMGFERIIGIEAFILGVAWLIIEIVFASLILWFLSPFIFFTIGAS